MSPRKRKDVDTTTYAGRFAARLKMLREKKKMTVVELAEKSGIPKSSLYHWEAAISMPPVDKLPELTTGLGLKDIRKILPSK